MSITTKTGDYGMTMILGKKNMPKEHWIFDVLGLIDEINATLGMAKSFDEIPEILRNKISEVQVFMFILASELSTVPSLRKNMEYRIDEKFMKIFDAKNDEINKLTVMPKDFIVQGGIGQSSFCALDMARTKIRNLERVLCENMDRSIEVPSTRLVSSPMRLVSSPTHILDVHIRFINRLSDYVWCLTQEFIAWMKIMKSDVEKQELKVVRKEVMDKFYSVKK
jgi:cob(I)alamin adenosyltransferase